MSNVYEERATMIAAGELQSFVPFGREHCKNHPNAVNIQLRQLQPASELWSSDGAAGLVGSLQEVTLHESDRESWQLRKGADGSEDEVDYEEELYVAGNMVIWSRGTKGQASYVYKAFTVDSPVQQALWCNFSVPQSQGQKCAKDIVEHAVCIAQGTCVNVHSVSGKDFIAPLPFQVSALWSTTFGLLLERKNLTSDAPLSPPGEPLPTLFSMMHPLDEIAPLVCRSTALLDIPRIQYVSDSTMRVVFASCSPSIIMTYDTVQCMHTVWLLRKVTVEEQSVLLKCPEPGPGTGAASFLGSRLRNVSRLDSPASPLQCPAFHNTSRLGASPSLHPHPRSHSNHSAHSPGISSMAALSRSHNPGIAAPSFCSGQRFNTSLYSPSPRGHSLLASPNSTMNETAPPPENELIIPDLCLEQLWAEASASHRDMSCQASKVFITSDLCENRYLCFLVESHQELRCVKFLESNHSSQLLFASLSTIPAKDAAPLEDRGCMLVLEANGSVVLYTGITRVSKVFVPGLLSPSLNVPGCLPQRCSSVASVSTPAKPFLKHLAHLEEHMGVMPSPVSDGQGSAKHHDASWMDDCIFQQAVPHIHTLRDAVSSRVTLELSNGTMLRITIPEIATSELVRRCLQAVRFVLPKETAMKVLVKWYNIYNAPGGPSMHLEWNLFVTCFMTLMGYNTERLTWTRNLHFEVPLSPVIAAKKARPADTGSDEDWEYLCSSDYHWQLCAQYGAAAGVPGLGALPHPASREEQVSVLGVDSSAPLFQHIPSLFAVLHLLYEDLKLDDLQRSGARALVGLLQQMARDLLLEDYIDLYWRDYPSFIKTFRESCVIDQAQLEQMSRPSFLTPEPPCVSSWLSGCLRGEDMPPFPYLPGICERTKLLVLSYALYVAGDANAVSDNVFKYLTKISAGQKRMSDTIPIIRRESMVSFEAPQQGNLAEKLMEWLTSAGFTLKDLESVPFGAALPIREAIYQCREHPCSEWSEDICALIGRQDLIKQAHKVALAKGKSTVDLGGLVRESPGVASETAEEEEDGMSDLSPEVTALIWSQDLRIQEVRRLLQSSRPVRVNVAQLPEVSDHEYIEEKENKLLLLCQRTMALPVGRGLFTLFSYRPVPTEPLPVPKLNLTGRAPPRNTMVDLSSGNIDVPPNMTSWASFHNGVAAGLKIGPASQVESAWIAYNKPKSAELANEYAGFLMALGLNGHLTKLATLNIHDYLTKGHEMTSIGLLLGVSAAKLGTMDMSITRLLSIHIPALLPPTSTELDVPHSVQVAAVVGIGLVYQGTGHRHNAEVLLEEIGRPPGPEMEYCTDRESYSLAAGLALGMVCLGHGSNLIGMTDLNVPEQLYQYMVGGHRRTHAGINRERHKSPSYQIKEGDTINVDVTCPGATLALAMIYLKTNNRSIADWLKAPDTMFLLDFIKPEFLLLRTLARCIIMWDEILPNAEWVNSNVPQIIQENLWTGEEVQVSQDLNMETLAQANDYIIAGACMAVGFRFAGSANSDAFDCLYKFARVFMQLLSASAPITGHYNVQTCLSMVLLSLAMVMSGSGDLKVLQLCRFLHKRVGGEMNYGFHMAHHIALGLLFLGGGRYTLSTSNSAIAALLCALYPHFPVHSTDNRYHLQALRHLVVLAAEPRLLVPVDVDTLKPCHALLDVTYKGTKWYEEVTVELMAPTLLPELHLLKEVRVKGPRYWELSIDMSKGTQHLQSILSRDGVLYVKLRAGQVPYKDDPLGLNLTLKPDVNSFKPEAISAFTSDAALLSFAEYFCQVTTDNAAKHKALYSAILYECVTQEKPEMLPTYMAIDQAVRCVERGEVGETFGLAQLKLLQEVCGSRVLQRRYATPPRPIATTTTASTPLQVTPTRNRKCGGLLLHSELLPVMKSAADSALDRWLAGNSHVLLGYMSGQPQEEDSDTNMLACFLTYHSFPNLRKTSSAHLQDSASFPELMVRCRQLGVSMRAVLSLSPLLLPTTGAGMPLHIK
ncbi:anaphase-promoting complex subunit 1 isoform X2 [Engraulis encrasicolus]|uniref:anaphase-promoting complex subunit 1 isoform X2 n=1 Tax=Engraulis encrasicolus TaxID=184585 RepID=UPI002FCEE7EA